MPPSRNRQAADPKNILDYKTADPKNISEKKKIEKV